MHAISASQFSQYLNVGTVMPFIYVVEEVFKSIDV